MTDRSHAQAETRCVCAPRARCHSGAKCVDADGVAGDATVAAQKGDLELGQRTSTLCRISMGRLIGSAPGRTRVPRARRPRTALPGHAEHPARPPATLDCALSLLAGSLCPDYPRI